ncbi:hypothetical protein ID866_3043 [Astraeus odoratus]|nr:hypothetical protein ID866_3043 [Astraeus odoratus]
MLIPPGHIPPAPDAARFPHEPHPDTTDKPDANIAFMKGPKRKRLAKRRAVIGMRTTLTSVLPYHAHQNSSSYFASKKCTYTDASGKPVPAPRPRPESSSDGRAVPYPPHPDGALSNPPPPFGLVHDSDDDRGAHTRKRFRSDMSLLTASGTPPRSLAPPILPASDRPLERDPALTRELVHLFFAYRQPQRMIIHQPSFLAALGHGAVPPYLLLAVCAVAAPLSRQPKLKTSPARYAGERFAQEAAALMFDKNRNLICEQNLATAQALCLLQLHDRMGKSLWNGPYHELALGIVTKLGIFDSDRTVLTPVPSPDFINASIELLYKRNVLATASQLSLRLPMDETSFELSPHTAIPGIRTPLLLRASPGILSLGSLSFPPEYMTQPVSYTVLSEIGQVIQILSLHEQIERTMEDFNNRENGRHPGLKLLELEKQVVAWAEELPDHLRFTDENLWVQMNVYETGSNMGAWCFGAMHAFHNSCVLALNWARQRCRTAMPYDISGAQEKLHKLVAVWREKVKLSILLGLILWPLFKYTDDRSSILLQWSSEFEDMWGVHIEDLCSTLTDVREQPLFGIPHATPPPPASSLALAPRVHLSQGVPPSGAGPGGAASNPAVAPRPPGPEPLAPTLAVPCQTGYPRAALDPRFHSQNQPPPQAHPVSATASASASASVSASSAHMDTRGSNSGGGHLVGAVDLRDKETGRSGNVVHEANIDPNLQGGVGVGGVQSTSGSAVGVGSGSGSGAPPPPPPPPSAPASTSASVQPGSTAMNHVQQSLPSLKASGLLEWPLPGSTDVPSGAGAPAPPASGWPGTAQHLAQPRRDLVRSPHPQAPIQSQPQSTSAQIQQTQSTQPPLPLPQQTEPGTSPRVATSGPSSGMPVGLQWLAHESMVMARQG